ncbi:hypothetical protein PAFU01_20760 [Pantoea ananatis]|nr:hypothetical protein PAFU01_20760 [Pantoea ananatis]
MHTAGEQVIGNGILFSFDAIVLPKSKTVLTEGYYDEKIGSGSDGGPAFCHRDACQCEHRTRDY